MNDGADEGSDDGMDVGMDDGAVDGAEVGPDEGTGEGMDEGIDDGTDDGNEEGFDVGAAVTRGRQVYCAPVGLDGSRYTAASYLLKQFKSFQRPFRYNARQSSVPKPPLLLGSPLFQLV